MNTIVKKSSATIKATHQELAIIEKALREYYWHKDTDHSNIRSCIREMIYDIQFGRATKNMK